MGATGWLRTVASCWAAELGVPMRQLSARSSFRTLSGNSLVALRICSRLWNLLTHAEGGGAFTAQLLESSAGRAMLAADIPRLRTALVWFEAFLAATGRVPFIPAVGPDALSGQLWNRATLDAFREFVRRSPPLGQAARGERVSADTISGYVSAIHLLRSREARYDVCPTEADLLGPLAAKQMRREEPPRGDRRLCRGLRLEHLAAAAKAVDRSSPTGIVEWATALTSHSALLRGG